MTHLALARIGPELAVLMQVFARNVVFASTARHGAVVAHVQILRALAQRGPLRTVLMQIDTLLLPAGLLLL